MLTCRDLIAQADALLAGDLSLRKRLSIRMHLALCHHCRKYVAQYRRMVGLLPHVCDHANEDEVAAVLERVRQEAAEEAKGR
ncbi:MAG: zf-HC2 domain-containing protein [Gammaproteobacteria bacterium]